MATVPKSGLRKAIHKKGHRTTKGALGVLQELGGSICAELIEDATAMARSAGRLTLRPCDFSAVSSIRGGARGMVSHAAAQEQRKARELRALRRGRGTRSESSATGASDVVRAEPEDTDTGVQAEGTMSDLEDGTGVQDENTAAPGIPDVPTLSEDDMSPTLSEDEGTGVQDEKTAASGSPEDGTETDSPAEDAGSPEEDAGHDGMHDESVDFVGDLPSAITEAENEIKKHESTRATAVAKIQEGHDELQSAGMAVENAKTHRDELLVIHRYREKRKALMQDLARQEKEALALDQKLRETRARLRATSISEVRTDLWAERGQ